MREVTTQLGHSLFLQIQGGTCSVVENVLYDTSALSFLIRKNISTALCKKNTIFTLMEKSGSVKDLRGATGGSP